MAIKISGTTVIDNSQNITNAGIVTATSFTGDGSQLTNLPGGGGNTLEATASGTLADGSKVIINTDGTVSVVTQTETTGSGDSGANLFANINSDYITAVFDSNSNRVVIFYRHNDASPGKGVAIVGEISGGSVTFGSPVDFETDESVEIDAAFDSTNNKVVVGYRRYASNGTKYHHARVGTVNPSNNSIAFGAREIINSNGESAYFNMIFDSSSGKIVVAYSDESNSFQGTARVGTVDASNNTISFGTPLVYLSGANSTTKEMVADTSANRIVLVSTDVISGSHQTVARVGTITGTSISFSSPQQIYASGSSGTSVVFDSTNNKVVVVYQNASGGGDSYRLNTLVGTVNAGTNTIAFGSRQTLSAYSGISKKSVVYDSGSQKILFVIRNGNNSWREEYRYATVNAGTDTITLDSATVLGTQSNGYSGAVYDSNADKVLIHYQDYSNSRLGTYHVVGLTGFSVPQIGTAVVFEDGPSYPNTSTFDSSTGKVVIAYKDLQDSGYGKAIVGTVSGTSISFGSPVTFENSQQILNPKIVFDSSSNQVVIIYSLYNNMYGHGIVGAVSGDTITFGSSTTFTNYYYNSAAVVFDSSNNKIVAIGKNESNSTGVCYVGEVTGTSISFGSQVTYKNGNLYQIVATFESSNNKVVIGYQVTGTVYGTAIVGEVSGTSISFPGSEVVFSNNNAANYPLALTFDSTNGKVVFAYRDGGNSSYGSAVVGEVSGTSISFGTPVAFSSAQAFYISATFDSSNNQVVIAYQDSGNSYYGTAVVGTVSGTSISFGTPAVFESANTNYIESTFDSTNNKSIFSYRDDGYGDSGTAITYSPRTISRNLTAENYIGISDGTYSNGQTATIQLTGAVDDAQSSLTPGQAYYVQNDGTLSETADNPSVFAGTALASTKLIVRG